MTFPDSTPGEVAETCRRVLRHREDTHRAALRAAACLGFPLSLSRQVVETRARLDEVEALRGALDEAIVRELGGELGSAGDGQDGDQDGEIGGDRPS